MYIMLNGDFFHVRTQEGSSIETLNVSKKISAEARIIKKKINISEMSWYGGNFLKLESRYGTFKYVSFYLNM